MGSSDHKTIDIDELANSLDKEFKELYPLSDECCIYRVPQRIRRLNKKLYTPQVVSIGLLHHGREELKAMEEHKKRYLQDFLQRTKVSMKDYLELIRKREQKLRNCYAESIKLESAEFIKVILVDAAFLIELFLRNVTSFPQSRSSDDRIFTKPWMIQQIFPDLYLLENQLPMFILKELFEKAKIEKYSMVKLACEFLGDIYRPLLIKERLVETNFSKAEHIIDLLRLCLRPPDDHPLCSEDNAKSLTTPCVKELHEAGVEFHKLTSETTLFNLTFDDGIFKIPKLKIDSRTESLFRNLQVYEQLHSLDNYMNDYIRFMNYLVNAPDDVEILLESEVIENLLENSEAVSTLFHNLAEWTTANTDFYYLKLAHKLNAYYKSNKGTWQKWKAILKRDYFNTPWAAISVIAAVILLVLSFVQTVFTIVKID